jgi:hypothetical protein
MENRMKILRFLIFTLFVLSLALSAAPAQAAGDSLVYLALVTQPDSQASLAARAQMEFQRLAPRLAAAQQAGQLIDFNPEFHAGILMLRFAGGADAAAEAATRIFERPVYGDVHDALRAVPRERAGRPGTADITPQFYVGVYDSCFSGGALPVNSHIIASLKDNTGVVIAKAQFSEQDDGNADGSFWNCFDWSSYNEVVPGYTVIFKVFNAPGGALLGAFGAAAPPLTFTSVNKTTAVIAGTGPANKLFDLFWEQPKLNAANQWVSATISGTVSAAKKWSGDVSTGKIRGGAYINITVYQTPRIAFWRSITAARIYCDLGGNFCSLSALPNQAVTLKVIRGATTYTYTGKANAWGWFWADLFTPAGAPIRLRAGDKVTGTAVPVYTLPALSFNAFDFANDIVSGKAVPNRYFSVYVQSYSSFGWWWYWAHSNAAGNFSVDTTPNFDLKNTETSIAEIYYIDLATGNITDATRVFTP